MGTIEVLRQYSLIQSMTTNISFTLHHQAMFGTDFFSFFLQMKLKFLFWDPLKIRSFIL